MDWRNKTPLLISNDSWVYNHFILESWTMTMKEKTEDIDKKEEEEGGGKGKKEDQEDKTKMNMVVEEECEEVVVRKQNK